MGKVQHTLSVTAIIENNGKFLFVKRDSSMGNFPDKWVFPGGKVEHGEDVIQALYRELEEETGLDLTNDFAFLSSYQFSRKEDNSSSQGLVFLVRSRNTSVKPDPSIAECRWINPEDITDYEKNTIYGMEVHVRNAMIILKKGLLLDKRLFSVTDYQTEKCYMNKVYFMELKNAKTVEEFLEKNSPLPHCKKSE